MKLFLVFLFFLQVLSINVFSKKQINLQVLYNRLLNSNVEIKTSKLNLEFKEQEITGAESLLYPKLSLVLSASQGEDLTSNLTEFSSTGSSPGSSMGSASSSTAVDSSGDSWVGQVSMSYYLFSGFAISADITRAKNEYAQASLDHQILSDTKKAQLLKALMEWQYLWQVWGPISEANQLVSSVKKHSKGKASILYSKRDSYKLRQRQYAVQYNYIRVKEGLDLVESALDSLIPGITREQIKQLPIIEVEYQIPDKKKFQNLYDKKSKSYKKASIDIQTAESFREMSSWQREWIPKIAFSISSGQQSDFSGGESVDSTSASITMQFNLFDGFYTNARRQQSRIGVVLAAHRRKDEKTKRLLYLQHQSMKAKVAKADFLQKDIKARSKKLRLKDVRRKQKIGLTTKLEVSASNLDFVNAQMEALSTLKDYQSAALDIAVEFNEIDKVKIYEKSN